MQRRGREGVIHTFEVTCISRATTACAAWELTKFTDELTSESDLTPSPVGRAATGTVWKSAAPYGMVPAKRFASFLQSLSAPA